MPTFIVDGGLNYQGTVQSWTVPTTTNYIIDAQGAAGGNSATAIGGKGARVKAIVALTAGHIIKIIVPKKGGSMAGTNYQQTGGGGGGAFVWNSTTDTLLVAAGGGGGAGYNTPNTGADALIGLNGNNVTGGTGYLGVGINGGTAGGGATSSGSGIGTAASWLSDGTAYSGYGSVAFRPRAASNPGQGSIQASASGGGHGGYGGGGAGAFGAGNGGGYSAGAVGGYGTSLSYPGGGGGSYASVTMHADSAAGFNANDGTVSIELANAKPTVNITSPVVGGFVLIASPLTVTWTYSDPESNPQTQFQVDYRRTDNGSTWVAATSGTGTATSYAIAGNTFDEAPYEVRVRSFDGTSWSDYSTVAFEATSWTDLGIVNSSAPSGNINATALTAGTYEVRVRVTDSAGGTSEWSDTKTQVLAPASNVYVRVGGAWVVKTSLVKAGGTFRDGGARKVRVGGVWKG